MLLFGISATITFLYFYIKVRNMVLHNTTALPIGFIVDLLTICTVGLYFFVAMCIIIYIDAIII